jgi:UDP-2,4-diacetamido-2,4,6-trideoxy-beta-L-altropyranose hydrolase
LKVVFRVDASTAIGVGHTRRCLTLAESLRLRGHQTTLIARRHGGHQIAQLEQAGCSVLPLPQGSNPAPSPAEDYSAWLGVTQEADAAQTLAALEDARTDWLVVDHYALNEQWEHAVRKAVHRIMVIDDLANRVHDCDLLLDQNFSAAPNRYLDLVGKSCVALLGPRYALLQEAYRMAARTVAAGASSVRRVFVFFGGTDPQNLTGLAVRALSHPALRHLHADIVVGPNYAQRDELKIACDARGGITVHGPMPQLAELMARAQLAIGAAGATTWERMCVGVPTLIISIARNQVPAAEALASAGLVRYLGPARGVTVEGLAAEIEASISNPTALNEQALQGRLGVDGYGTLRVAECMDATAARNLNLRPAHPADVGLFFSWVNDPAVRQQSLQPEPIPWSTHRRWFDDRLADGSCKLFVLEARALPVGQIRFELNGGVAHIDYSIDAQFRGRGWAHRLMALGMEQMAAIRPLAFRAQVKASNPASMAVFHKLGFRTGPGAQGDLRVFSFDTVAQTLPAAN